MLPKIEQSVKMKGKKKWSQWKEKKKQLTAIFYRDTLSKQENHYLMNVHQKLEYSLLFKQNFH